MEVMDSAHLTILSWLPSATMNPYGKYVINSCACSSANLMMCLLQHQIRSSMRAFNGELFRLTMKVQMLIVDVLVLQVSLVGIVREGFHGKCRLPFSGHGVCGPIRHCSSGEGECLQSGPFVGKYRVCGSHW